MSMPEVPAYTLNADYQHADSVPAAEIHHHGEEERSPTVKERRDTEDDIPGKGPGGMPQKYFVVS
jgi:hypothetical protein